MALPGEGRVAKAKEYAEELIKRSLAKKYVELDLEYLPLYPKIKRTKSSQEILARHKNTVIIIDEIYEDHYDKQLIKAVTEALVTKNTDSNVFILTGNYDGMEKFLDEHLDIKQQLLGRCVYRDPEIKYDGARLMKRKQRTEQSVAQQKKKPSIKKPK
jgi:hypothetical protein